MGAAGVVVGSWPLYLVARRGGQAFLGRRLSGRAPPAPSPGKRSAFAAIAGPAFVPPPMPLKIFVLLAGRQHAPWRLVTALVVGRGSRHAIEAGLAAAYRDDAVRAFDATARRWRSACSVCDGARGGATCGTRGATA
jgi:membrane protein YqaA with SNARE-associated domain